VSPIFSRKAILSFLWIVPTISLCVFAARQVMGKPTEAPAFTRPPVKVPIEVLKEGQSPTVIYVELDSPAIPEPSTLLLLPLSAALMFRRKR
jgi:hypothetical protein